MTRRILALALVVLMIVAVFVACKEPSDDGEETTPNVSETTPADTTVDTTPVFEDKDYGGKDFTTYMRTRTKSYGSKYITPGEDITDPMEAATYERNLAVEEKYKVKLVSTEATNPVSELEKLYESGDITFDVLLDQRTQTSSRAQKGYLYDWNNIEHISWDRTWWDASVKDGYTINDKLYFAVNDISIGNLTGARFLYFNKKMLNDFNLTSPYTYVEKNEWTLDNFLGLVKAISVDNGDGVWDGQDQYGMLAETSANNGNIMYLLAAAGVKYIESDANGNLVTNAYSDRVQSIASKVREVFVDTNYVCYYADAVAGVDKGDMNTYDYARKVLFTADHFLFVMNGMGVSTGFKDMQSDYGVAPNPKADASQERYYHKMDKYSLIWSIPNSDKVDYDRLGIIMEYWAYKSGETVMPTYYETTIQTKIMRDPTDTQMLDLIKSTMVYDLSDMFVSDIPSAIFKGYESGDYASSWEAAKETIDTKLADLNAAFAALN